MGRKNCKKTSERIRKTILCVVLWITALIGAAVFTAAAQPVAGAAERLAIVSQPKDYTAPVGEAFYFSIDVNRTDVTYLWQVSTDGGGRWIDSSGKTKEYSSASLVSRDGNLYRCVITASDGSSVTSAAAKLTVCPEFGFLTQPKTYVGELEDDVLFEIQAGGENISYVWEISADGTSWSAVASSGTNGRIRRFKTKVAFSTLGKYYRCVISDPTGRKATSDVVRILLNRSGFRDYSNERIYIYYDGRIPNGITEIDGKYYYFTKSGVPVSGFIRIDGEMYHFDGEAGVTEEHFVTNDENRFTYFVGKDGKVQTGWIVYKGKTYYCGQTKHMARGLTDTNGGRYYFDFETGEQKTGLIKVGIDTVMYFNGKDGRAVSGMKTINGKTYYFSDDIESFGAALSGILSIDGTLYYFRDDYGLNRTEGFFSRSNKVYYSDKNGKCLTGFNRIKGKLYLFGSDGAMKTGNQTVDGENYLFTDSGEAFTGWYDAEDGNRYYYMPDSGKLAKNSVKVDGVTYYLKTDGGVRTGMLHLESGVYYYAPDYTEFSGWLCLAGKQYYVNADRSVATGIRVIDGKKYFFSTSGVMQTGVRTKDGGKYYFAPYAVYGFRKLENGSTYYFREDGTSPSGLQKIDGKLYCFNSNGGLLYGYRTEDGKRYYFDENSGEAQSGWKTVKSSNGGCYSLYFDPKTFCACTGLKVIDGKTYYFAENGYQQTGYQKVGDTVYYFDDVYGYAYTGFLYVKSKEHIFYFDGANGVFKGPGMRRIDGKYYCFNADNYLRTGMVVLDGKRYYFDPQNGELISGFFNYEGKTYYSDGLNGIVTGLQTIDGNKYRFGSAGDLSFGFNYSGGVNCCYDRNTGVRTYGILKDDTSGTVYCLLEDGSCGKVVSYGGVDYSTTKSSALKKGYAPQYGMYFDEETGERQYGLITFILSGKGERTYYFSDAGETKSVADIREALNALKKTDGWKEYGGERYYVKNGEFLKGIQKLKGTDGKEHRYYFSRLSGVMLTGLRNVDGSGYLFDAGTGEMLTGRRECDGRTYYFDPTSGKRLTGMVRTGGAVYCYLSGSGMLKNCAACVNGENYIFDENGAGTARDNGDAGKCLPGMDVNAFEWVTTDGGKYFTDVHGKPVRGERLIKRTVYFFDENGLYTGEIGGRYYTEDGMQTGFVKVKGKTYYFDPVSGYKRYGELLIGSALYYFDLKSGEMRTGWVNGKYYGSDGKNASGWLTLDGEKYWFDENGSYATGIKKVSSDGTYLFDDSGKMLTGLVKYCGGLYYAETGSSGRGKLQTGFVQYGGKLYYFDRDEFYAVTGMRTIDSRRYYFNPSTYYAEFGLVTVGANRYYFEEDGKQRFGLSTLKDGTVRYFGGTFGEMKTGLWNLNGVFYYFDPDTGASVDKMAKTELGGYYCVKAGGGLRYGLQNVDGKEFYFKPKNGLAVFGLQAIGYKLYYFDENNGKVKNDTVRVGNLLFKADNTGALSVVGDTPLDKLVASGIKKIGAPYYDRDELTLESTIGTGTYSCSLLIKAVYEDIGVVFPYSCPNQYYSLTHENYEFELIGSLSEARSGDIVYMSDPECRYGDDCGFWGEIHHVALYLGDGKVLEASGGNGSTNGGMTVQDLYVSNTKDTFIFAIVRLKAVSTKKSPVYSQQVRLSAESFIYNGSVQQPKVTVTDLSGKVLTENTDYTVTRVKSSAPGTYSVTVECKGAYEGKITKNYSIEKKDLSGFTVSLSDPVLVYNGKVRKPTVTVKSPDGKKLTENTDYTVTCPDSVSIGKKMITVVGVNNYTGMLSCAYTVKTQSLSGAVVTVSPSSMAYNGSVLTPSVTVKDAFGTTLTKGVDYIEDMPYAIASGTYTAAIRGIGGYAGETSAEYKITGPAHSKHVWDEGSVMEAPGCVKSGVLYYVCTVCGAVRTEACPAAGHTPGAAKKENVIPATAGKAGSYDEVVYCSVCGEELSREKKTTDPLHTAHTWDNGTITEAPDCTKSGVRTYVCTVCGEKKTETVPANGHTPGKAVKENEVAATCAGTGSYDEVVYCSVCKAELSRTGKTVEKTAHTPGKAVKENEVAATCVKTGSYDEVVYCSVCKAELSRTGKTTEKTAHTPGAAKRENEIPAAEGEAGSYDSVVYCAVCGKELSREKKTTDPLHTVHKWDKGTVTTAPDCTKSGVCTYVCTVCGEEKTEAVPARGHTPGKAVKENEIAATCSKAGCYDEVVYCTVCKAELSRTKQTVEKAAHTSGKAVTENEVAATCSKAGSCEEVVYCTVCKAELSRTKKTVEKAAHTPGKAVKENNVAATCAKAGSYDEVVYCSVCKAELSRTKKTAEKIAHTSGKTVKENNVAATCSKTGSYDEVVYCSVCKAELSRTRKTVEKLAHTSGKTVKENNVAATCAKEGSYDEVVCCSVCKAELSRTTKTVEKIAHTPGAAKRENEIPAAEGVAGSYEEVVYCTACGKELSREEKTIDPLHTVHKWDQGTVTEAPDCTKSGVCTYVCTVCGDEKTETVPAKGHTPGKAVKEKEVAATCAKEGSVEEVIYCTVCKAELSRTKKTVGKVAHTPGKAVKENEVAATCAKEGGVEEVVYCTVCKAELSRAKKTVEKVAHTPGKAVKENEVAATCAKEGSCEEVVRCTVCKAELSRTKKTVEKAAHTPGKAVKEKEVAATCAKTGSCEEVVRCTVCKAELSRSKKMVEKIDHTPGKAVKENEVAATCAKEGSREEAVYCTVCKAELSRTKKTVEKTAHTPGEAKRENEFPAAPEKAGSYDEVVRCTVCGEELSREKKTIPALPPEDITPKDGSVTVSKTTNRVQIPAGQPVGRLGELVEGEVRAVDKNGKALPEDGKLCTGCVIQLLSNGKPVKEYTVIVMGDIDRDGNITSADARLALRASVGLEKYEAGSPERIAGDVEYDEKITASDARLILRGSVGLEDPGKWKIPA